MGFQGSLDTVGLTDIFQLFGFGRKSGALHLHNGAEHGVIHFDEGDVFYATMNPGEVIGNLLVRAELVTPDQWKQVLDDATDGRAQGEVLATVEGIDTVAVEVFLRERVEDAVFRLAQWEGGEFELTEDVHPFGPVFRFQTEPLLATAERRMDDWRRITAVVPSVAMGVQIVRDLPGERGEVTLTRDQWRLIATVTPGCDVADVAAGLGDTEFRTCDTLAELVEGGLVELVPQEKLAAIRAILGTAAEPSPSPDLPAPGAASDELEPDAVPADDWVPDVVADAASEAEPEPEPSPGEEAPRLSLAELAAAAEDPAPAAGSGFTLGDLSAEYPPPEPAGTGLGAPSLPGPGSTAEPAAEAEPVAQPYLEPITPPPAVYTSSFDMAGPAPQAAPSLPYADLPAPPIAGNGTSTGEVPAVDFHHQPPVDFPADTPLGAASPQPVGPADVDAAALADAATGDSELDKSLILRLIAGVKSL